MFRFFCTTCQRVKRVRAFPYTDATGRFELDLLRSQTLVGERTGVCRFHVDGPRGSTRAQANHRGRVRAPRVVRSKPIVAPQQPKGRKREVR